MRLINFKFDAPVPENVHWAEVPDLSLPGLGEVLVGVEAFPINPSDLQLLSGRHTARIRAIQREMNKNGAAAENSEYMDVGGEGTGRLLAVGSGVHDLQVGQPVIMLGRQNWREQLKVPADSVIPVPEGIEVFQRAMLKTNPGTAWTLLHAGPILETGDWVIQTAGNSALGRILIRMARKLGFRTVSVVRREDAVRVCEAAGGDVVLVYGPNLKERVTEATERQPIRLAVDAVGGLQAQSLVECVSDGGHYVVYGFLGGDTLTINIADLLFRRVSVSGLVGVHALPKHGAELRVLFAKLAGMVSDGDLVTPVDAVYEINDIRQAITHAMRGDGNGKVIVKTRYV